MLPKLLKWVPTLCAALALLVSQHAQADGMYPLDRLPADRLAEIGVELSVEDISNLAKGAVPKFNDGCSSSLLSDKGLIFTNHHCGAGLVSDYEAGIVEEHGKDHPHATIKHDGYIAPNMEGEIKMEGANIKIYLGQENVSDQLLPFTAINDPHERHNKIEAKKKEIVDACKEAGGEKVFCEIKFMNDSPRPFELFRSEVIDDIRLVWAPAEALGRFGGDTDNWEYPRFSNDFTFFRAYKDDKPYEPTQYASFSNEGFQAGDPQLIIGYPGSTERNITAATAEAYRDRDFYWRLHIPRDIFTDAIEEFFASIGEPLGESGYYDRHARLENYNENGKRKSDLVDALQIPKIFRDLEGAADSPYVDPIRALYRNYYWYRPVQSILNYIKHPGVTPLFFLAAADQALNYSEKKPAADASDEEKAKVAADNAKAREDAEKEIRKLLNNKLIAAEKFIAAYSFERILRTPNVTPQAILNLRDATENAARECATNGNGLNASGRLTFETFCMSREGTIYQQMATYLYTSVFAPANDSAAGKEAAVASLIAQLGVQPVTTKDEDGNETTKSAREVRLETGDPLFVFLEDVRKQLSEINTDPQMAAGLAWNGWYLNWQHNLLVGRDFPDATFSMRATFGIVTPEYMPQYKEVEAPYRHATTLQEWGPHAERSLASLPSGSPDAPLFVIPDEVIAGIANVDAYKDMWYYDEDLGGVPVNAINDTVITGGNSGSPVFNGHGEVVGIAFDGTPESIIGDVMKNPAARTIIVDARLIAFLGDVVYPDARYILEEAGMDFSRPAESAEAPTEPETAGPVDEKQAALDDTVPSTEGADSAEVTVEDGGTVTITVKPKKSDGDK